MSSGSYVTDVLQVPLQFLDNQGSENEPWKYFWDKSKPAEARASDCSPGAGFFTTGVRKVLNLYTVIE